MKPAPWLKRTLAGICLLWFGVWCGQGESFRIATYNLENYIDEPVQNRRLKSPEARAKVREGILALKADVLAVQEIGKLSALEELRAALKGEGLDYPYSEFVRGFDTNIHVALLSKFPFAALRPRTNENFLLNGRRFQVSRGFAEADIKVGSGYDFTIIAAHLKSKRPIPQADQDEVRQEEAKVLRRLIDEFLAAHPDANLVVLGDFNDRKDAPSTRTIIGRGKTKLVDTRPAERNGDTPGKVRNGPEPRNIAWTEYYAVEDTYSRFDYILLSPSMAKAWLPGETYVLTIPNWGLGSDHRPVVAAFETGGKPLSPTAK